jgi:oxalate decarboxylase/phosphoglucose isomerase-like protein (cupin superfamily)
MRLKPGGIRELHCHIEAEWSYMIAGRARIGLINDQGRTAERRAHLASQFVRIHSR